MKFFDRLFLILLIIGALNWGSIGLFGTDFVEALFGQSFSLFIFSLVGLAGLWCIRLLFTDKHYANK